jgi:hypothetical protein
MKTRMEDYGDGKRRPRPRDGMSSAAAAEQPSVFGDEPTASVTGPRSRRTDPITSHAAAVRAAENKPGLSKTQAIVLELIRQSRGLTDDELVSLWPGPRRSPQRLRTCRADLVKLGYVKDSGRTAPSDMGNQAVIWVPRPRP